MSMDAAPRATAHPLLINVKEQLSEMDRLDNSKHAGKFSISDSKDVYGELTFAGLNTSLYLRDEALINPHGIPGQCVKGVLHDLTKVTLVQCVTTSGPGYSTRGAEKYHFATIFPHYVVYGDHHIAPNESMITEAHFVLDDASTLFYDFDAFGSLINARPYIEQIVTANNLGRVIATGSEPEILYFAGKREIFAVDTILGKISAQHNPISNIGGPNGVSLKNEISVTISFSRPVTFHESIDHTSTLLRFFEILVGRQQNVFSYSLGIRSDGDRIERLFVYWSALPDRGSSRDHGRPDPADVLLDAIQEQDMFSRVLSSWLDRDNERRDARGRFASSFSQRRYSIDRLIGAANMFDILPDSAAPEKVALSEEIEKAKQECQHIVKKLEKSLEMKSLLDALGRLGNSSLKHKIRYRGEFISAAVGMRFPDLLQIIDQAVDCRNYYVHGGKSKFDYNKEFDAVCFFTDTLEFVFAASDLIEAGWNISSWINSPTSESHPFGSYRVNYSVNLMKLRSLLNLSADSN